MRYPSSQRGHRQQAKLNYSEIPNSLIFEVGGIRG